jgi:hypothetical protein
MLSWRTKGASIVSKFAKACAPAASPAGYIEEVHDLTEGGPEMFRGFALDLAVDPAEAPDEKLFEVPADAVRRKGTEVVKMQRAVAVHFPDLGRIDLREPVIRYEGRRHVRVQAWRE